MTPTRPLRGAVATGLGFGAAQIGNLYRATSDDEARSAVDEAWRSGIRYFDTAPHYGLGLSERRLGEALKGRVRDKFVVSTKVGRLLTPTPDLAAAGQQDSDGFAVPATHRREWDFSRDGILRSIEESLNRLQLDRLDIVYLHDPDEHWHEASTTGVDTLVELRDESVIGAIGAGMNQTAMLTRFVRECDVDVVMVAGRFTLLDRTALDDLLPAALERGVAVVAAAVYNSGLLSSSSISDDAVFDYEQASPDVIAAARSLATTCRSVGVDLPAAAVQFPLRHPAVESVVVGMRSAAQVRSTAARFRSAIQDDAWRALESSA